MNINGFLLARIAEDEAAARLASPGPWEYRGVTWPYDPARVLAECAAKRAIIHQVSDIPWAGYAVRDFTLETLAAVYNTHPDYRQEWSMTP